MKKLIVIIVCCLWPEQRWKEVIITVNPPVLWELGFAVVQE